MTAQQRNRLSEIEAELSDMRDTEQTKYDNLPDSLQSGAQGDKLQEGIDALENAISEIQQITSS